MNVSARQDSASDGLTITLSDLSKRFNREWIFNGLNYQFTTGNTYAITGPNGSGKSTLLQVVWGQVPQSSGTIRYEKGPREIPIEESYRYLSIATPYMDLIEEFTLSEMLNFHFTLKKIRNGMTIDDLMKVMYLQNAAKKQLINFSSGMKQRLKLALAFYTQAEVYFLDEPGTNLDQRAFDWYRRELALLPENCIVFIASNNHDEYPDDARTLNILDFKQ
ncbi:MAG TPA: ATP-binding cassette domain-containing protein [Chryseosolibacter sp.]|nr:ATP-binding cassette domain-containing protein [Chryseosolibacter sp.]